MKRRPSLANLTYYKSDGDSRPLPFVTPSLRPLGLTDPSFLLLMPTPTSIAVYEQATVARTPRAEHFERIY